MPGSPRSADTATLLDHMELGGDDPDLELGRSDYEPPLIETKERAGGGDGEALADQTKEGVYAGTLDLGACPAFNTMGGAKCDRVVRDTDGVFLHALHELAAAGLWCVPDAEINPAKKKHHASGWRDNNWKCLLEVVRFSAYAWEPEEGSEAEKREWPAEVVRFPGYAWEPEEGSEAEKREWPAMEVRETFAHRRTQHRRLRTTDKPWDFPEFRALQRHIDANNRMLDALLRAGFKEAKKRRQEEHIPLRRVVFLGDMLCGDGPLAGDMVTIRAIDLARYDDLPVTIMASNHGFFFLKLFQFIKARFGGRFAEYLRENNSSPEGKPVAFNGAIREVLHQSLQDSLRTRGAISRDGLIDSLKRQRESGTLSDEQAECSFQFIRSIPVHFLEPYESALLPTRLRQLLSFSPVRNAVLRHIARKNITLLTQDTPISLLLRRLINASTASEEVKSSLLSSLTLMSRGELLPLTNMLERMHIEEIDSMEVDPKKAEALKEAKPCLISSDQSLMKRLNEFIESKIHDSDMNRRQYGEIKSLFDRMMGLERIRQKKLSDLNDILATTETRACFDVSNEALMEQLLTLRGKSEIFTDLRHLIDESLMALESVLRHLTTLPSDSDLYRASATSVWAELLPRYSSPEMKRVKDSQADERGERLTIRLMRAGQAIAARECYVVKDGVPISETDLAAFHADLDELERAHYQAPDVAVLDEEGRPTKHVAKRATAIQDFMGAWSDSLCFITRAGIQGPYMRHAPAVGLAHESPDQSMIRHALLPVAEIMLHLFEINSERGRSELIQAEAATLIPVITEAITVTQRYPELAHNPTTHKIALLLMNSVNKGFDFFKAHELLVFGFTDRIPETHLAFLSPLRDIKKRNSLLDVLRRSGHTFPDKFKPGDIPFDRFMADFGSLTLNKKREGKAGKEGGIFALYYPVAAWLWNRFYGEVTYVDQETGKELLSIRSVPHVIHGHTSEPGTEEMGLDREFKPGVSVIDVAHAVVEPMLVDPGAEAQRLAETLGEANHTPDAFWAELFKRLIELDMEDRRERSRTLSQYQIPMKRSRTLSQQVRSEAKEEAKEDDSFKGICRHILEASMQIKTLLKKEARDPAKLLRDSLASFLSALERSPLLEGDTQNLRERLALGSTYLPPHEGSLERAEHIIWVIDHLKSKSDDSLIAIADQLSFWIVLYTLDRNTLALVHERVACYLIEPAEYPSIVATVLDMRSFSDALNDAVTDTLAAFHHDKQLAEDEINSRATFHFSRISVRAGRESLPRTSKWRLVSKFFAMLLAAPIGLASTIGFLGFYQLDDDFMETLNALSSWGTWLGLTLFFEVLFILAEVDISKMPSQARWIFKAIERFVPRDSAASQMPVLALLMRPFLWVEFATSSYRVISWAFWEVPFCDPVALLTNMSQAMTTTSTSTASSSTPPVPYADTVPWVTPGMIIGSTVGGVGFILSLITGVNLYPGQQPPIQKIRQKREKGWVRAIRSIGRGFNNWVSGNLVTLVGSYAILVFSGVTCGNPESAVISSSVAFSFFVMRFFAYPPQWMTSCCIKMRERHCPQTAEVANCLNLSDQRKRTVETTYNALTVVFSLPLKFFLLGFYGSSFIVANLDEGYDLDSFMQTFFDTATGKVLFAACAVSTGVMVVDEALAFAAKFHLTNHVKRAQQIREATKKRPKGIFRRALTEGRLAIDDNPFDF